MGHICNSNCVKNYPLGEPPYICEKVFEEIHLVKRGWNEARIREFWAADSAKREHMFFNSDRNG